MTEESRLVLLVADDEALRAFVADNLTADGYAILAAGDADQGRVLAERERPHAAIVDLALPASRARSKAAKGPDPLAIFPSPP